ncbi:hypothetical protein MRX96_024056 [Rhipicephalus microplus]
MNDATVISLSTSSSESSSSQSKRSDAVHDGDTTATAAGCGVRNTLSALAGGRTLGGGLILRPHWRPSDPSTLAKHQCYGTGPGSPRERGIVRAVSGDA